MNTSKNIQYLVIVLIIMIGFPSLSCKKFIEVDTPVTSQTSDIIYSTDANATSALIGIYATMSNATLTSGALPSLSLFPALSSDELTVFNYASQTGTVVATYNPYYLNALTSSSFNTSSTFWGTFYAIIYRANAAIEGLTESSRLTPSIKDQLLGEAFFIRALSYFYLVNLYGSVPLSLTTDYQINRLLSRSDESLIYTQIKDDLKLAQTLLSVNYLAGDKKSVTAERTGPNKATATALLARVYLYSKEWSKAEIEATSLISNTATYDTVTLSNVFLKNNKEAIWQLQPVATSPSNTRDARLFVLPAAGPNITGTFPVYLSNNIVNDFEPGDLRKTNWTKSVTVSSNTFVYPYKYKNTGTTSTVTEYLTVFRLGEQYLIRSEAKAQQNNLASAVSDLNVIRKRAGLLPVISSISQTQLLDTLLHERKVELFTEFGHRWLDLKRTGKVNTVMSIVTPQKGGTWNANWSLYPIPQVEINNNSSLAGHQNQGY